MDSKRLVTLAMAASPAPASPAPAKKKGGMGKFILGCGCLLVLIILAVVVAAAVIMYLAAEQADAAMGDDFSVSDAVALVFGERGTSVSATATKPEGDGKAAAKRGDTAEPSKEKTEMSPAKVRAALAEPLTPADVDRVFAVYDGLKKTNAYERWHESLDGMKKVGRSDGAGAIEQMARIRDGMKGFDAYKELFTEYDRLVKKAGGFEPYLASLTRIAGAAAAAKQIAKEHKLGEPASDKVADKILSERAAIKKAYEETSKEAADIAKKNADGKGMNPAFLAMMQQPGTIAMGRMPEKSFEAWKKFAEEQRKRVIELPQTSAKDFPGMILGVTWSGEPLIISSEFETLNPSGK